MVGYVQRHPIRVGIMLVGGIIVGTSLFLASRFWLTFEAVATEDFDPAAAAQALRERTPDEIEALTEAQRRQLDAAAAAGLATYEMEEEIRQRIAELETRVYANPAAVSPTLPDEMFEAYLGVGSDASGVLADAILLALAPTDGAAPILVSIPRDLYVRNPCTGGWARINSGLGGCKGFASGTELIALMVEGYTGIQVDHVARVTFDGFAAVVSSLGGVTICTDYPSRDPRSGLDLPGGCVNADGYTTLAWVRSRHTEQLIDGTWKVVAGSDFNRQSRQQDVLFQLAGKLASFGSLASLDSTLAAVAASMKVDSGWSAGDVLATAWRYRGITREGVNRISVSVSDLRTSGGAQVLAPTRSFNELLANVYPPAARS
ncbi:MAG TPA: LCP family protein [Acidimicrobiia bacterium]|nr:LCP family protein [Acidimicrobiia bacterium]